MMIENSISDYGQISKIVEKIYSYSKDKTVDQYLKILNIDSTFFSNIICERHNAECTRMVKSFLKYPIIFNEICVYLKTKKSKLDFLNIYSDEQIKYITNLDIENTKLLACAGSGKTRSIIGRIKFLVEHGFIKKENVFMITFSKPAAVDFHCKIKTLFPDFEKFCRLKNFSTIDSLAKSILCKVKSHKSDNVEILSIAFRNFLKEISKEDTKMVLQTKNIRHLFIDEAQDLNEIQYDIIVQLQKKISTICELIGDPNQNIYQFRRSSSTYLINFPGKTYELTLNFRSSQQIIDFAEYLKPIPTTHSQSANNKTGPPVTILTKTMAQIHATILRFIELYKKEKDLSDIAIICPTRGIGIYDGIGLSVFFNFLKSNNIPFNQLYDESGSNHSKKISAEKKPGHINLITYHGTKGLEFDVVFIMDFYHNMFNIKPTEEEHRLHQYLLYVATSRAISMMFICTYTNTHGGYLNHWITNVSPEHFISDAPLKIPKLAFRDNETKQTINGITEIISELNDEQLNIIHDILNINEDLNIFTRKIYKDFTDIDRGRDETLFGIFCEELFYLQYNLSKKSQPRKMDTIQKIIDLNFVIVENDSELKILKNYIGITRLTWQDYDAKRNTIPKDICRLIEKYYNRDRELNECLVCTNTFIKIVEANMKDITDTYIKYLNSTSYTYDYKKILVDFFYLIVVQYAYDINHYYYINNHGKDKHKLLENGNELYEAINNYVSNNYLICNLDIKILVKYPKLNLLGEIDFMEQYPSLKTENIVEIKCAKDISIKYYIQLLLYNFCYYYEKKDLKNLFGNKFKIINLLTGLEHHIFIEISPLNMFNLLAIIADVGGLKFDGLNLVYDLETTDKIKITGPLKQLSYLQEQLDGTRVKLFKKGVITYGKKIPEITEIVIRDYDTGMIILNTLVKPRGAIPKEVQTITGITPSMLTNKPDINSVRLVLEKKMKNFTNCKMLAHNGARFDNEIILYDKLIDPNKISFLDTMSIIPIHLPKYYKLDGKSLGNIYKALFGKKFNAHRAMADVNALIKIMRYLKINF